MDETYRKAGDQSSPFLHSASMSARPRVLVIRFSALGDVILTTSLLRAVRLAYPEASLTFATKSPYADLLANHPAVDRVVSLRPDESVRAFVRRVTTGFDRIIDLQNSIRTRAMRSLIPGIWTSVRKSRFSRFRAIWTGAGPGHEPLTATRYLQSAGEFLPVDSDPTPDLHWGDAHQHEADTIGGERLIALAPGASRLSKRWNPSKWAHLARSLTDAGYTPIAVGRPVEAPLLPPECATPAWHLSLPGTVALLARCKAVVAHDSGLMHAATAVHTPVVALFGPTVSYLGFAPHGGRSRILERSLRCRPCTAFGESDCPAGHHRCLSTVTPDDVLEAVEQVQ